MGNLADLSGSGGGGESPSVINTPEKPKKVNPFEMHDSNENFAHFQNYGIIPIRCLHNIFLFLNFSDHFNILLTCHLFSVVGNTQLFWKEYYSNFLKGNTQLFNNEEEAIEEKTKEVDGKINYKRLCYEYSKIFNFPQRDRYYKGMFEDENPQNDHFDEMMKFVIVGEESCGKSAYVQRWANKDVFSDDYRHTIGVEFVQKTFSYRGKRIKVQIWDTAGQIRFREITKSYYRGAMGMVIGFSLIDKKSFLAVGEFLENVRKICSTDTPVVIVGLKLDLAKDRVVTGKMVLDLFRKHDLIGCELSCYCECSSKEMIFNDIPFGFLVEKKMSRMEDRYMSR